MSKKYLCPRWADDGAMLRPKVLSCCGRLPKWKGCSCHKFLSSQYSHHLSQHSQHHSRPLSHHVLHFHQDGDTETKRRAVEQAEEEDFGNSMRGQVIMMALNSETRNCQLRLGDFFQQHAGTGINLLLRVWFSSQKVNLWPQEAHSSSSTRSGHIERKILS